jgi:PAS domain S-box-containing protein
MTNVSEIAISKCIQLQNNSCAVDRTLESIGMNTNIQKDSALILIADDDRFTRMLLRQIIEEEGYRVEEVGNGEQCLAAYTQLQPDMVLLDAMMPVMDGFSCCTQLQPQAGDDGIPILMITGLNDQASVDWAFEAGATDFVTKPIHPPVLRRRVRRLIEASWAEKALRESEKKYRSVVENVKEVIFQTNAAGDWTFLNPAWISLTGFTVEESLGMSLLNYVHPDDRLSAKELWQALIKAGKEPCAHEMRYLTKAGEFRWVEIHALSTLLTDGAISGLSGTIQDITKRKQAEALEKEKLRLENEILERRRTEEMIRHRLEKEKELGELKSRIISTISHEFRTPMTTILGSAELLRNYGKNWSDEKRLKHFQRIEDSVEHVTQLLNDVTLIGQAEVGQLQFNPTQLDVEATTRKIVKELQRSFESYQQGHGGTVPTLVFSSQGNDTQGKLDEKLLGQILTNLLSNANKFSPQGGVVRFDLVCQQGQAIFRVRDEGMGIPPADRERVFESFYRASNAALIQGTGLGLAIAKKCVDLHGGQITVESEVGVGTTFTVTLPLNPVPTREADVE